MEQLTKYREVCHQGGEGLPQYRRKKKKKNDSLVIFALLYSVLLCTHTPMKRLRMGKVRNKAGRARTGRLWLAVIVTFCAHGESSLETTSAPTNRHVCCVLVWSHATIA